jgi:hypothetical protein
MALNWLLIAQNSPRGYNRLIGETAATQRLIIKAPTKEPVIYLSDNKYFHERDLYDFFDEQKIYISIVSTVEGFSYRLYDEAGEIVLDKVPATATPVQPEGGTEEEPAKKKAGRFKKADAPTTSGAGVFHPTRREAEQFAFEDAFALLEEK